MPIFTTTDDLLDTGETVFSLLGGFWSDFYAGSGTVRDYSQGLREAELQTIQDTQEVTEAVSRRTIPVYRRARWLPLTMLQLGQLEETPLTYEATDKLGASAAATLSTRTYDYELPANTVDVGFVVDKVINPTAYLVKDVDYLIEDGVIRFLDDPFQDNRFRPVPIFTRGTVTDRQITLWLGQVDQDRGYIKEQFGYALGLDLGSSVQSRRLVDALWNAELLSPSPGDLVRLLSVLCDAPVCQVDGEIVEGIVTEAERQLVITSNRAYKCSSAASILVTVGQVLALGEPITDAFEVIDLSQGVPDPSVLSSLTLPTTLLIGAYSGGLGWANSDTALIVTYPSGRTRVEWALTGAAPDQTLFWNTVHTNGIAAPKTLAMLLDTRDPVYQTNDPLATMLPTVINPLEFLVENILAYGTMLVRLTEASFGEGAFSSAIRTRILRTLSAPQGMILVI